MLCWVDNFSEELLEEGIINTYLQLPADVLWDTNIYQEHHKQYESEPHADPTQTANTIIKYLKENQLEGEKFTLVGFEGNFQQSFLMNLLGDEYYNLFYTTPICVMQMVNLAVKYDRKLFPNMKYPTICAAFGRSLAIEKIHNVKYLYTESLNLLKGTTT
jgi:hypothetical protein